MLFTLLLLFRPRDVVSTLRVDNKLVLAAEARLSHDHTIATVHMLCILLISYMFLHNLRIVVVAAAEVVVAFVLVVCCCLLLLFITLHQHTT